MNKKFYRDLREIVLAAKSRERQLAAARRVIWHGRLIETCGEADPRMTCMPSLERPHVSQPHSCNEITGPTC